MLPLAVALAVAMRILFGRARRTPAEPMQVLLSVSSITTFVFVLLGGLIGTIGVFILFIPLPLLCIVLGIMVWDRTRRSEHRSLVWALAAAAGRGIPLPEAARAFADETPSRTGVRSLRLAEALEQGQSLATASRSARLRMGTAMRLTVRLAEALGLLGPAMKQQIEDSQQIDAALRDAIGRFFYLATVVLFMQVVVTFLMLKIVPVFQRMFEEFGLKLPELTMFVIHGSAWFVRHGWVFTIPLILLFLTVNFVLLVAAGWQFLQEFIFVHLRYQESQSVMTLALRLVMVMGLVLIGIFFLPILLTFGALILYYIGAFPRGFPLIWPLFRRYDGALVMRGLALALRRGMPMPEALKLVEESYPLSVVSRRIAWARQRVESGMDWRQALLGVSLITQADAAVLAAAERVGNLDWALEEMASSSLRRQAHRVQVGLQILFPILLLSVGLVVFIIVCGLFMPLISLIQGLT
jgi:type II secretory pathway component PulF